MQRTCQLASKLRRARRDVDEREGWIGVRGLRCHGRQGTTEDERRHEHEYLIDISVRTDLRSAIQRDELDAALDIAALAAVVREEIARRPRALIERMASDVADQVLARFDQVSEVSVRVEKPRPAGLDAAAESVELSLRRGRGQQWDPARD